MTANMDTAREFSAMVGNETITNISRIGQKLSLDKSPVSYTHLHRSPSRLNRRTDQRLDILE